MGKRRRCGGDEGERGGEEMRGGEGRESEKLGRRGEEREGVRGTPFSTTITITNTI